MRRIRSRHVESIRGRPGRRERRRQHRRNPSRCQRSTVAGWINTSASRHRGQNHRKDSHSSRSVGRKRRFERVRTPSWWRRARVSSSRSVRVAWAARTAAPILKPPRIACRLPSGDANVNGFCLDRILATHTVLSWRRPSDFWAGLSLALLAATLTWLTRPRRVRSAVDSTFRTAMRKPGVVHRQAASTPPRVR